MEYLRTIKISVELDTNKATYSKTFESVDAMIEWLVSVPFGERLVSESSWLDLFSPRAEGGK